MNTKATSFTFDIKNKVVSSFNFINIDCMTKRLNENMICDELKQISKKQEMSFTSKSVAGDYSGDLDFEKQVKGTLLIGDNKFNSEFLFSVNKKNKVVSFVGMITFKGDDVLRSTSDKISINIKGMK